MENEEKNKIKELPSSDSEFWDGEKFKHSPTEVKICKTHSRQNWVEHIGYIDNKDGTISCKYCGWGCFLPGYYRVLFEKIIDLRTLTSTDSVS